MRACRLVVDTGIQSLEWTRAQGIAYFDANMPSSHYDNQREVERYIVIPGQATSYYIGMQKIMELRARARDKIGDRFDLRHFHDIHRTETRRSGQGCVRQGRQRWQPYD